MAVVLAAALVPAGPLPVSGESLTVLTYNLWHGFWRSPAREVLVLPSEAPQSRRERHRAQEARLDRLSPDVLMAQEVHPLPWRARGLAGVLAHREIHQLVSCGVRFLHLGLPWGIRSGLVISARPNLGLERLASPVLSGRFGFCSDWLGLQLEETRRALIGRIRLADGRRLLVVTTHLHSSTVGGARRSVRRLSEVNLLLAAIARARRIDRGIAGVILGGDFNALGDAEPIERLRAAGFVDVARSAAAEFPTYDPWTNPLAAEMTSAGGGDPARSAPRRIDFVFVSRELVAETRSVERYGAVAANASIGPDSDHFGVLLTLDF